VITAQIRESTGRAGDAGEEPATGGPRRRFELLQDCRDLALLRLSEAIGQAVDDADGRLAAEASAAVPVETRPAMQDALRHLKQRRAEVVSRFARRFGERFEQRLFALDPAAGGASPAPPEPPRELALVSEDAIEDRLQLDRLVERARGRIDPDEELGVCARLGALLERDWFEPSRHPLAPDGVFDALSTVLGELLPPSGVRGPLLAALETPLSPSLGALYAAINHRLRGAQVLPRITPRVAPRGAPHGGPQSEPSDEARRSGPPARASVAEPPPVSGGLPAGGPLLALQRAIGDVLAGRGAGHAQIARLLSDPATFASADLAVTPAGQPLVASLTALQRGPVPAGGAGMLPELVRQASEHGSPLDRVTVEIVSMVFDYIYADRRLPDPVKQQLLRLQVVAVKAALLDRSFFARRQHPMRRLIDRISDVGADPDLDQAPGAPWIAGLATVVDRLLAEFDRDLTVFDEAAAAIESIAREQHARRAAHLEVVARRAALREAFALAREVASAELERRLQPGCPPFVRAFVERWWTQVLVRTRQAGGERRADRCEGAACETGDAARQQAWEAALDTADRLLWSVEPKRADEIPRLAALLPALIRDLELGLSATDIGLAERATFFDALMRAHTLEIAAARQRGPLPAVPAVPLSAPAATAAAAYARAVSGATAAGSPSVAGGAASDASRPSTDRMLAVLRRGERIELAGSDGPEVLKLAWISPGRTFFILTRHPDRALTLPGAELAFMLRAGQARIVPWDSTLDRAIGSVGGGPAKGAGARGSVAGQASSGTTAAAA